MSTIGRRNREVAGVVLLFVVVVSFLVVAAARAHQRTGAATARPPAPPPSVGACLDQQRAVVDCAVPHRWEVVAAWAADDPDRERAATTDACERSADGYGGIARAARVGSWTVRATVVTAVLDAPPDRSAGPTRGWTVCGVQPAWADTRSGSLGAATSVAQAPDFFALCVDFLTSSGGIDCHRPHDVQVLGSWQDAGLAAALRSGAMTVDQLPAPLRVAAAGSCLALASAITGAADATYGGLLRYPIVLQPGDDGEPVLNCLATPAAAGRVLVGSITALGKSTVPLR